MIEGIKDKEKKRIVTSIGGARHTQRHKDPDDNVNFGDCKHNLNSMNVATVSEDKSRRIIMKGLTPLLN